MNNKEYEYLKEAIDKKGEIDCYFRGAYEGCNDCFIRKELEKIHGECIDCLDVLKVCKKLLKNSYISMLKEVYHEHRTI